MASPSSPGSIDTAMARRLVDAQAIRGASIIGVAGGWSVTLRMGLQERPLVAQRTHAPRTWRSLDSCVAFLKDELHLARFDLLDATGHSEVDLEGKPRRADAAERLRQVHAAAEHDKWFREQVEIGLAEADDPNTQWVSNEEVEADWAIQRAELLARIEREKNAGAKDSRTAHKARN